MKIRLFFFVLLLLGLGNPFPTFFTSDLVKVYTKISKFQQTIAIDLLNNKDDLPIVKLTLEQILTSNLENSRISILFQLISWIVKFFERVAIAKPKPTFNGKEIQEISIYNKLRTATLQYVNNRERKSVPEFLDSIGEDGKFIDKTKIVGCSNSILFGKNKIQCLKKFIKLVKKPTASFIGIELIDPLISYLNLPISPLKNADIKEFAALLGFNLRGPNINEELLNKVIALKTSLPTAEYLEVYRQQTTVPGHTLTGNLELETTQPTPVSVQPNTQLNTNTDSDTNIITPGTDHLQSDTTSDENLPNPYDPNESFKFLLSEIAQNEQDIARLKTNLQTLENNAGNENLEKIRLELSELSNKIEEILNDGHNNEEEYNGKLILLNGKLEELNLADAANVNTQLKTKVNELEEALAKMLEANHVKTTNQNEVLNTLKNDINGIKQALANSITMFNNDKDKLQVIFEPLNKLSEDVENLKLKLQDFNVNSVPTTITETNTNARNINMKATLLHVINNLIIECEHIKLLLSKPKESKYIPEFLNDKQIKYVQFSTVVPNIFEIEWDYYDGLTEEHIISPISLCDKTRCYHFTNKGYGKEKGMFESNDCVKIIENEY